MKYLVKSKKRIELCSLLRVRLDNVDGHEDLVCSAFAKRFSAKKAITDPSTELTFVSDRNCPEYVFFRILMIALVSLDSSEIAVAISAALVLFNLNQRSTATKRCNSASCLADATRRFPP